jgi:hypothetical protein
MRCVCGGVQAVLGSTALSLHDAAVVWRAACAACCSSMMTAGAAARAGARGSILGLLQSQKVQGGGRSGVACARMSDAARMAWRYSDV